MNWSAETKKYCDLKSARLLARELASEGAAEGTLVVAEHRQHEKKLSIGSIIVQLISNGPIFEAKGHENASKSVPSCSKRGHLCKAALPITTTLTSTHSLPLIYERCGL
jgi:hypothetical protein